MRCFTLLPYAGSVVVSLTDSFMCTEAFLKVLADSPQTKEGFLKVLTLLRQKKFPRGADSPQTKEGFLEVLTLLRQKKASSRC